MMYSVSDIQAVLDSPIPNQEVYLQAMQGGRPGALILQLIILLCLVVACMDLQLTQARMSWSFARDGGLPFSKTLSKINKRLRVPLYAQLFGDAIIIVLGFLYLFAAEAFNALVGSALVLSNLSLIVPVAAHLITRRKIPTPGPFWLGKAGFAINFLTVCWLAFFIVAFNLPYFMPVVGDIADMNWTCAVVGGIFVLSVIMWFVHGRKSYEYSTGVPATFDDVLEGQVVEHPVETVHPKERKQ